MKKKISVLTLALSCLRLAGCAKTVSKDEAVKAAGEFKVADVKDKFVGSSETTTDTRKSEVCLHGVKTSKDPKKDTAKKDNLDPTAFLVSSATISAASSDGVFKQKEYRLRLQHQHSDHLSELHFPGSGCECRYSRRSLD